jgi:hypothetical protein
MWIMIRRQTEKGPEITAFYDVTYVYMDAGGLHMTDSQGDHYHFDWEEIITFLPLNEELARMTMVEMASEHMKKAGG